MAYARRRAKLPRRAARFTKRTQDGVVLQGFRAKPYDLEHLSNNFGRLLNAPRTAQTRFRSGSASALARQPRSTSAGCGDRGTSPAWAGSPLGERDAGSGTLI